MMLSCSPHLCMLFITINYLTKDIAVILHNLLHFMYHIKIVAG